MLLHYQSVVYDNSEMTLLFESLIFILVATSGVASCPAEDKVLREVLEDRDYRKYSRPVRDMSDRLTVHLQLKVLKVIEVDELKETMMANVHHTVTWRDHNLRWNRSAHSGLEAIYIPSSMIWLPDIIIRNSVKDDDGRVGRNYGEDYDMVRVKSDGTCMWWPTVTTLTHCHIKAKRFPFDEQTCSLEYVTTGYNHHDVRLKTTQKESIVDDHRLNGEWQFIEYSTSENEMYQPFYGASVSRVIFNITIRREPQYYTLNFFAPCIILHLLSIFIFVIPRGSERVDFGVAILLAFTVYQMVVSEKLPATSDAVSSLSIYFLVMMIMCALSIIWAIVARRLDQKEDGAEGQITAKPWKKISDFVGHIKDNKCKSGRGFPSHRTETSCESTEQGAGSESLNQSSPPVESPEDQSAKPTENKSAESTQNQSVTIVDILDFLFFILYAFFSVLVIFLCAFI